jgi:hypothetical protein
MMGNVRPVVDIGPHPRPGGEADDGASAGELVEVGGRIGQFERAAAGRRRDSGRVVNPMGGPWRRPMDDERVPEEFVLPDRVNAGVVRQPYELGEFWYGWLRLGMVMPMRLVFTMAP